MSKMLIAQWFHQSINKDTQAYIEKKTTTENRLKSMKIYLWESITVHDKMVAKTKQ